MPKNNTEEYAGHYAYTYKGVRIDPYRILHLYNITNPAHQHALKKLLRAGKSIKDLRRDIEEVIMTLERWQQMLDEDSTPVTKSLEEMIKNPRPFPPSGGLLPGGVVGPVFGDSAPKKLREGWTDNGV